MFVNVMKTSIYNARLFPLIWAVQCVAQVPSAPPRLGAEFATGA
jgi:hypothetical protein